MGFGFNLFSFIITVLFWWLIIMVVIKLAKSIANHHQEQEDESQDNANLEIVKERYAKGEIKKKEYQEMKKELLEK
jgi:putative membrane protein